MLELPAPKTYIVIDPHDGDFMRDFMTLCNEHLGKFAPTSQYDTESFTYYFGDWEINNDSVVEVGAIIAGQNHYEDFVGYAEAVAGEAEWNRENPLFFAMAWYLLADKGFIPWPEHPVLFRMWW